MTFLLLKQWLRSKLPDYFVPTYYKVLRNSFLTAFPFCSCPELGACISSDLWCDGLRHCPSGNDEQEINCAIRGGFPPSLATTLLLLAVLLAIASLSSGVAVYVWKHFHRERKNVIVSVTEHTFLEFKSGLC